MSDCSNAEIRDLLPDLLHDRLDARTRARVVAHVDGCADCRSELELLRSLRDSLERGTPRVHLDRIVAALPSPASVRPPQHGRTRRVLHDWRIAAAVTFIVAGGTSLAVIRNARDHGTDSTSTPVAQQLRQGASETTASVRAPVAPVPQRQQRSTNTAPVQPRIASAPSPSRGGTETVASTDDPNAGLKNSRIENLNAQQLKSLLKAIENMDATPITEPEPVTLHVGSRGSSPNGL